MAGWLKAVGVVLGVIPKPGKKTRKPGRRRTATSKARRRPPSQIVLARAPRTQEERVQALQEIQDTYGSEVPYSTLAEVVGTLSLENVRRLLAKVQEHPLGLRKPNKWVL